MLNRCHAWGDKWCLRRKDEEISKETVEGCKCISTVVSKHNMSVKLTKMLDI